MQKQSDNSKNIRIFMQLPAPYIPQLHLKKSFRNSILSARPVLSDGFGEADTYTGILAHPEQHARMSPPPGHVNSKNRNKKASQSACLISSKKDCIFSGRTAFRTAAPSPTVTSRNKKPKASAASGLWSFCDRYRTDETRP